MNNKKGQWAWAYGMMLGLVVILLAIYLAPVGQTFINDAMNESTADFVGMNCSGTTSNFVKGACVVTDFSSFYFFTGLLLLGGAVVGAKIIFGGSG